ncbi:MAG: FtsX-like permease family protein [Candidatus Cloacimonetes bacterium]|jgi:putative ABC transport system permease protein|nr:FtsX-like permease family protein [Candidatus Cloacimonadota bacterium]MBT4575944.1 FtsX-like permease family protein [Candidatus Cloacimonadota bacterium]
MFKNYIKIAYRNILKQKTYSAINIFGLALGLTACILVGLYIYQDFNYDNYHANGENIYRVSIEMVTPDDTFNFAQTPAPVAPSLKQNYPEINKISRIFFAKNDLITYEKNKFYEEEIVFADEDFFKIFSYSTLQGNPNTFLQKDNSVVITKKIADKYFGTENPVGKILNYNSRIDLEVVGVVENVPINSHFTFDMVVTYNSLIQLPQGRYLDQWGATFGSYTYVLMHPGTDLDKFVDKAGPFLTEKMETTDRVHESVILQPIKSIHMFSNLEDEINPNSSITYILILGSISLFILILACINFVNLTTARAVKRAREIGVRKVFGAFRLQLVRQFLGESIITTLIALAFAFVFVELFIPLFSQLIGTTLVYSLFDNPYILLIILAGSLIIGILAGLYPAFVLTHFQPALVMKGATKQGKSSSALLRKGLVLFQFSISIILIIFTILINKQINFMRNFDMGFEKEQIVVLKTPERMSRNSETIKEEINAIPGVIESSTSLGIPLQNSGFGTNLSPYADSDEDEFSISVKMIDSEYIDFYQIPLLVGRKLTETDEANYANVTVVNEATVKKLGFANNEDALGHNYTIGLSDGVKRFSPEIVGVIEDFHFNSLHEEVSPLLFMYWYFLFQEISIKISPQNVPETMKEIKLVWEKFYPEHPFVYSFLDEDIDKMYKAEARSFRVISTFSFLAIIIACMGLLGLTFYTTEQRRKEIGIRKILGASIPGIVRDISLEFLKLVVIANVIAWPISYFLVKKWLMNFPYKIDIGLDVFLLASGLALLISFVTIGYTVIRSAYSNPIDSIKYE